MAQPYTQQDSDDINLETLLAFMETVVIFDMANNDFLNIIYFFGALTF